jgi:hypothetical protein
LEVVGNAIVSVTRATSSSSALEESSALSVSVSDSEADVPDMLTGKKGFSLVMLADFLSDGRGGSRLWIDVGRTENMIDTLSFSTRTFWHMTAALLVDGVVDRPSLDDSKLFRVEVTSAISSASVGGRRKGEGNQDLAISRFLVFGYESEREEDKMPV